MRSKVLIPLLGNDVAPRFDLAGEVWLGVVEDGAVVEDRTLVLPQASAENLCRMILTENVNVVVCCGIEQEFYDYLGWKRVTVFDSVIGSLDRVLDRLAAGQLAAGDMLCERPGDPEPAD